MSLKYSMKIKVRCKEKLSDNKDRLLRETVETPLLTIFTNRTDEYKGGSRCAAPYPGCELWSE